MRHLISARRAGVLLAVAAGGVLVAGPARAGVTVNPPTAAQGQGADLQFHVTNGGSRPVVSLTLSWPADTPVAEAYPLSMDDWAPRITWRTLTTPLTSVHGGVPVTEVARDITWVAMPGRSLAPGAATDLTVSLGPMPTLSSMPFTLVTTDSGGQAGPPMPASVTLRPLDPAEAATAHAGHDGSTGADPAAADPDADLFARTVAAADAGPSAWTVGGWVVAGMAVLAAAGLWLRRGRTPGDDERSGDQPAGDRDDGPAEPAKELLGARVTSWSYRDGPEE